MNTSRYARLLFAPLALCRTPPYLQAVCMGVVSLSLGRELAFPPTP